MPKYPARSEPAANQPALPGTRRADLLCVLALALVTLAVYSPALFGGKVLLPADVVPLMRPWSAHAHERFPDLRLTQNQLLGPIFEYYSWRYYARERIHAGEVPLWNPYELGGNVLLANNQSAVLYPPNALLYLCPLWIGINLVTALHTFLTGLFLYGLLRTLRLRPYAALTGAFVWMFCGIQMAWTEFQTPTAALCWLPGALWGWERYLQAGRRGGALAAAACLAMALMAGHMQFAFYVALGLVLYAAVRIVPDSAQRAKWPRRLATLLAVVALGATLAMASLLPLLEMARMNFRAAHTSYENAVALRLPPINLLTLFQPDMLGNPRDYAHVDDAGRVYQGNDYWGAFQYVEFAFYVGVPALILALVGAGTWLRRSANPEVTPARAGAFGLSALALVGLLLALGTPLCLLFFYGAPGYRQFNAPARALCLFDFGMAGLAAYGVEAVAAFAADHAPLLRRAAFVAAIAVAALGLVAFPGMGLFQARMFTDQWFNYETQGLVRFLGFTALTGLLLGLTLRKGAKPAAAVFWLLPVAAAADLLLWGAGFNPMTDPGMLGFPTATTDFLRGTYPDRVMSLETPGQGVRSFIVPNYNAVCGIREAQGADSLHTWRFDHFMALVVKAEGAGFSDPNTLHYPSANHRIFDMLNVRYVTTTPDRELPGPRFTRAETAELSLWENHQALGRAWVVGAAETSHGVDAAYHRLSAPDFDPRRTALLETAAPALDPAATGSPIQVTDVRPHRVAATVDARGSGLAVFSETAFPGWRATVDGRPAPILTADYLLRGVPVPAGRHAIEMRYDPTSYRLGVYLTCAALALALACGCSRLAAGRRAA